jgi:AcrR family transcriptional regulator
MRIMGTARPYTKVARAEGEERTRTALLDAAEEMFFSWPWDQVTLAAVASRAGVTKQTLLRHFGSKEGLLEQGFTRAAEAVEEQRFAAPTDDIEGAIDNLLDHYDERGDQALKLNAMDGSAPIAELRRRARRLHYEWVRHAFGPWLDAATAHSREHLEHALIALCDVHTWAILSRDLGLPRPEVRAALILAIRRLLEEDA